MCRSNNRLPFEKNVLDRIRSMSFRLEGYSRGDFDIIIHASMCAVIGLSERHMAKRSDNTENTMKKKSVVV